jgi:hypothetical protein
MMSTGRGGRGRVHFQIRGKSGGLEEGAADIGVPAAALVLGAERQHGLNCRHIPSHTGLLATPLDHDFVPALYRTGAYIQGPAFIRGIIDFVAVVRYVGVKIRNAVLELFLACD